MAISRPRTFEPKPSDAAGVVSWVHLGDLHMTEAGEQNHTDLLAIVDELNDVFADSLSFAFLPGDVADDGSRTAYAAVRGALDRLRLPWCAIVGDHDVHEKSFANFLQFMMPATHYAFTVGDVRFVALNAFDIPDPGAFCLLPKQLSWLEEELQLAEERSQAKVLLLHCYPSDLKSAGEQVSALARKYGVRLIDMGHTHYNEIANDGCILYTATRSTGQIEEGRVGFSITNLDDGVVSWRFFPAGGLPAVMITSPADLRLLPDASLRNEDAGTERPRSLCMRAKAWARAEISSAVARWNGQSIALARVAESQVWEGSLACDALADGVYPLAVRIEDAEGKCAEDAVKVALGHGAAAFPMRAPRDQDNALDAWGEHGLLGTQLGPNKNGRKW